MLPEKLEVGILDPSWVVSPAADYAEFDTHNEKLAIEICRRYNCHKALVEALIEVAKIQREVCSLLANNGTLNSRISNTLSYLVPQALKQAEAEK